MVQKWLLEFTTQVMVSPINTGGIELYELNSNTSQYEQVGIISHGTTEEAYLGHTTSINNDGSIFAAGQYQRNVDTTGTSSSTIEGGVLIFERSGENINHNCGYFIKWTLRYHTI